jgi:hypothetical protein
LCRDVCQVTFHDVRAISSFNLNSSVDCVVVSPQQEPSLFS